MNPTTMRKAKMQRLQTVRLDKLTRWASYWCHNHKKSHGSLWPLSFPPPNSPAAAAAAAKSLQSCPTLCDPIDKSPPGSPVHGILQARTLEQGAIAFSKNLCYDPTDIWVYFLIFHSVAISCSITKLCCCCSATESCLSLCDPMDSSMPSLLVHHYLLKVVLITKIL